MNSTTLKNNVASTIIDFFNRKNNKLGQILNINQLNAEILSIEGISNVYTVNGSTEIEGLQFIMWNPFYPTYTTTINSIIELEKFQFPFLNNTDIISRLVIV